MKITGTLKLDTEDGNGVYEVTAERDDCFEAVIGLLWWQMDAMLAETQAEHS